MGERLLCKQEVIGSIPFTSTTLATRLRPRDRGGAQRRRPRRLEKIEKYRSGATWGGGVD